MTAHRPPPVPPFERAGDSVNDLLDRLFPNWRSPEPSWPPKGDELTDDELRFGADALCLRLVAFWLCLTRTFR